MYWRIKEKQDGKIFIWLIKGVCVFLYFNS